MTAVAEEFLKPRAELRIGIRLVPPGNHRVEAWMLLAAMADLHQTDRRLARTDGTLEVLIPLAAQPEQRLRHGQDQAPRRAQEVHQSSPSIRTTNGHPRS